MESNSYPYFSIVIPTKNRPKLLKDAIRSVLQQNFEDYELIVSDNFNDQETQDVIEEFKSHPKFKSYRVDAELNMINHWEFATKKANGKYVILLADRKVLCQNALKKIQKYASRNPDLNAFSFGVQLFDETKNQMGWSKKIDASKRLKTSDLIQNLVTTNIFGTKSMDFYFPKTLNGCYKNDYASKIRSDYGTYFNIKGVTTPDFSSFIINCALNHEVGFIGEKLILTQGESSSNGRQFGAGKFQAYMDGLKIDDPYKNVEIKAPFIFNLLMVDFYAIRDVFKQNIENVEIDIENYYYSNYFEINMKEAQGLDEAGVTFFKDAWAKGLENHPSLNKEGIIDRANTDFHTKVPPSKIDKAKQFKSHLKDYLALRYSEKSVANKIVKYQYKSVLDAAGFKEE